MDRRDAIKALSGLATGLGIPAAASAIDVPANEQDRLFVLKFSDAWSNPSPEVIANIHDHWRELFDGKPPKLIVLSPGMDLQAPLPGRYAFSERLEDREVTTTFQTYEELCAHIRLFMKGSLSNYPSPRKG